MSIESIPSNTCPCGSGASYERCCGKFHARIALPATAEALMRSRYTAFVKGLVDYLINTRHPSERHQDTKSTIQATIDQCHWQCLTVLKTEQGGENDTEGFVTFTAKYQESGTTGNLSERSYFKRDDAQWFYVSGKTEHTTGNQSPGRNEPCWCGSGKKFKKCHG